MTYRKAVALTIPIRLPVLHLQETYQPSTLLSIHSLEAHGAVRGFSKFK